MSLDNRADLRDRHPTFYIAYQDNSGTHSEPSYGNQENMRLHFQAEVSRMRDLLSREISRSPLVLSLLSPDGTEIEREAI